MAEQEQGAGGGSLIDQLADWLIERALLGADLEVLFDGCCRRLHAAGIPLWRGSIGFSTLHPLFAGMGLIWMPDDGVKLEGYRHGEMLKNEVFANSPIAAVLRGDVGFLRRRLVGEDALLDFPVLEEFRSGGGTDYLIIATPFSDDVSAAENADGMMASWVCDRPTGFSDRDIEALSRIQKRLAVACKVTIKDQIAHNVLDAYLGRNAGARVLGGQIRLGDGEEIEAVIWFSDLRDSTPLADSMSRAKFLAALNDYFEATAGAVIAHGGEVLRFVGDAVLAIFPIGAGEMSTDEACHAAVATLDEARERLDAINRRRNEDGEQALDFGAALHIGEVLYGNIGVAERVEFTVVGAAANEAARIESLTKTVGYRTLASKAFADAAPGGWVSLGRHALRGVGDEVEVFARDEGGTARHARAGG